MVSGLGSRILKKYSRLWRISVELVWKLVDRPQESGLRRARCRVSQDSICGVWILDYYHGSSDNSCNRGFQEVLVIVIVKLDVLIDQGVQVYVRSLCCDRILCST